MYLYTEANFNFWLIINSTFFFIMTKYCQQKMLLYLQCVRAIFHLATIFGRDAWCLSAQHEVFAFACRKRCFTCLVMIKKNVSLIISQKLKFASVYKGRMILSTFHSYTYNKILTTEEIFTIFGRQAYLKRSIVWSTNYV